MSDRGPFKRDLFESGKRHIAAWCRANGVLAPHVVESEQPKVFATCAYYRDGVIYISVGACAAIGTAGRQWSYPGYVVDRTPYGVLAHELGHHVDRAHGPNGGIVAASWHEETREKPITSYAPNVNEWFAEIFRLYVTNPDLLRRMRPRVSAKLVERWPHHVETRTWDAVLADAPRQIAAARNKVAA